MSTLTDSTLAAPAIPDTTLGPDPGQYLQPEIAMPDRAVEYTPPVDEDLQGFARMEFDGNEVFEEMRAAASEKRAAELARKRKLKKMLMAVAGVAVVGAMALGAGNISPEPTPAPEPVPGPVEGLSTIRQVLSEHPNWYSAEYDVYLHFNEGVGWLYDHGDFHRLVWTIQDEGADDERLVIETGYGYLFSEGDGWHSDEFTSELQVTADGDSATITGVTGIGFHDDASTTFTPVDTIGVNSTYVDRFGAMTGQQILEAIGTFVLHGVQGDAPMAYHGLAFAGGSVTISADWARSVTALANYQQRLNGHIYTDEVLVYPSDGGEPYEPGRIPGIMIIREDNVYFYLGGLQGLLEFVPGSIPEGVTPEPVAPPKPAPAPSTGCPTPSTIVGAPGSKISHSFSASPYERGTGSEVLVAVYVDEFYLNGDFWGNHLIADYKCPEEDFQYWDLPSLERATAAIQAEGDFEAVGYVMYYGPLEVVDDTYGTFYWGGNTEFAVMLDGAITWDDVQFIPPDEHGVRYVNIHVVYAPKAATGDEVLEPAILADDGLGNITAYVPAVSPFASAGVTWLGSLPTPEMDCYWFAGWFNEDGEQIWYVWNEDIYEYGYDRETETQTITVHPVTIYAGWVEAQ